MRTAYLGLLFERRVRRWSPVDREARRGQAECAAMSGRIIPAVPTRSGPRSPTFFIHLHYRLANSWRGGGRPQVSPSGIVDAFEAPHRAIGPYERSAQPRAQLHRTLPLHHSPDGRAPWAPSAVQAAIARNSPKKAFPEETSKMADGQLGQCSPFTCILPLGESNRTPKLIKECILHPRGVSITSFHFGLNLDEIPDFSFGSLSLAVRRRLCTVHLRRCGLLARAG